MLADERNSRSAGQCCISWHVGRQGEIAGGMTQVINGYLRWRFEKATVRVITSRDGSHGLRSIWLFIQTIFKVLTVGSRRTNMVVVHLSQGGSFLREGLLLRLAHLRGLGTVAHLHGSRFVAFSQRRQRLVAFVLRAADKIIVLSEATKVAVARLVVTNSNELLPNAVPTGQRQDKERLIVFGGSVSHRKGVDVLIEAWQSVGPGAGWRLVVAGPPDGSCELPTGLQDVDFPGGVTHDTLMKLLSRSAIAVLPSRDEAMPMFILEALARANCVIATRVGGIPSVLADGCGVLVDPGNVEQLKVALAKAMVDDSFRNEVAQAGFAMFDQQFSAAAVYPRAEALWAQTLHVGTFS